MMILREVRRRQVVMARIYKRRRQWQHVKIYSGFQLEFRIQNILKLYKKFLLLTQTKRTKHYSQEIEK